MPAPIVLSTLTPETKRVPNPPQGQPVIATKAELRDGSRVTEPVTPPPGDGSVLHPMQQIDLSRIGSGTQDPLFDPATDITYLGAFRIPYFGNDVTSTRDKSTIAFKPAEAGGRNGPNGSLFFGGAGFRETFEGTEYPIAGLCELQIPSLSTATDHAQLSAAPILQNFVNVYRRAPTPGNLNQEFASNYIGAITIEGDKAYLSMFEFYATGGANPDNLLICSDCRDLAGASYQGFLTKEQLDLGSKYTMKIPPEHQATFGATHFNGVFASHSIIGRSSFGPALVSWTPGNIQSADTTVSDVRWTYYDGTNSFEMWDYESTAVKMHYEAELGVASLESYCNSDPSTRLTTLEDFPLPAPSLYSIGGNNKTRIQCAFIPPGTDTVMLIGRMTGQRYGLGYKGFTLESGINGTEYSGYYSFSEYDVDNFFWTLHLDDVATAVNPWDVGFAQAGVFDDNRWLDLRSSSRETGIVQGGTFDPATGRLFILQSGFYFNDFNDQHVVSVYQVGGGV